ncbi:MAG: HlyC/CorC family transporter [Gammaproteobacteria bacterium]|nr:HlyC/CorC family transporter [Gammaproteobacteria bacterium]
MDDIPLSHLFGILILLIFLSAFFSGSETGMMALNRYRLRHMARDGHRSAVKVEALLKRPDRLLGLILFGNTLVNAVAASVATLIGIHLLGELGLAVAPIAVTLILLIFAEVAPKTLAAIHPERIAYPAAYILTPLGKLLNPFVWVISRVSNSLLRAVGARLDSRDNEPITPDELRTIVVEAGGMIPLRHQRMLLSILDLESVTVNDIMVPRNDIVGIDLDDPPEEIIELLDHGQHTRLPVYRGNIENIVGMLHVRRVPRILWDREAFQTADLEKVVHEPYFVPMGTPLHQQLLNFQRRKRRIGLVVDEYGVIQGLLTLEDILEEIVGEFTTGAQTFIQEIHPQEDGSYVIDGSATIRDINRQLHWDLPAEGPRTLNGLILEHLETIPEPGTGLRIGDYTIEITQSAGSAVRTVRARRAAEPAQSLEPG